VKDEIPDIVVHDYAGSVTARYDDMRTEAALVARFADEVADAAFDLERVLIDPDLLASAILNPGGVAKAEFELMDALNGPRGLLALALELKLRGIGLDTAVNVLRVADAALAWIDDAIEWSVGYAAPYIAIATAPVWMPAAALVGGGDELLNGGRLREALPGAIESFLVRNAWLVDEAAGAAPGLLTGLADLVMGPQPFMRPRTIQEAGGLLALLYRNGAGAYDRADGMTIQNTRPLVAGREVHNLLFTLNEVDKATGPNGRPVIQVRELVTIVPGGRRVSRWIVDIPGTSKWNLPGGDVATDTSANLHSMAGHTTAYQQAIQAALADAGAKPGQQVMLVGHSLGGMVAMQSAGGLTASGYNVTHVLTAGSPLASYSAPPSVQVLSLENTVDVVTRADGKPNPTTPNWTTLTFEEQFGNVGQNHGIDTGYLDAAHAVDASTNSSVAAWRDSLSGYLDAEPAKATVYEVHRP
jgi:hypothetical protein